MAKKLFFTILIFPLFINAQTFSGFVKSQIDDSPIDNVNVYAIGNQISVLTNTEGKFSLNLKEKVNDTLQISHIGFVTKKLTIKDLKKSKYIILLEEEIENLENVEINSKQPKLKSKLYFNELAPLKDAIHSFASLIRDGKIYVSGGDASYYSDAFEIAKTKTNSSDSQVFMSYYYQELRRQEGNISHKGDFSIYDIKTNTWQKSDLKLIKRAYHDLLFYNNSFYILGGKRISANAKFEYLENQIEIFDIGKNEILIDKTNPHQAINFLSFIYKDNVIIMGGAVKTTSKGKKTFTNKVHFYNIISGLWYELSEMPFAQEANGTLIENKIYLIGGNNGKPISKIQSFDLTNNKWLTEGELFSELERPAVTSRNNLIYFFESKKIYTYDVTTKILKEFLIDINAKYSAMHLFENKLYIIGGMSQDELSGKPSHNTYSISIDEFQNTRPNRIKTLK